MAWPVYSTKLYEGSIASAEEVTAFTVPAGKTYVVRDIDIWTNAGAGVVLNLATVVSGPVWVTFTADVDGPNIAWRGRQIYAPGELLVIGTSGGTWNVRVSGYVLQAS